MVSDDNQDTNKIKSEIRSFINNFGLTNIREPDLGKNQLMLLKKLNREDVDIYVEEVA